MNNLRLWVEAKAFADFSGYRHDSPLMKGANVVNLTRDTFVHDKAKRFGDVFHVHVASLLLAFAVDSKVSVGHGQVDKLWDQLFWVLTRTVDVVPSSDDDWQVVRNLVRIAKHFSASLGGCVRVGWAHGSLGFVELAFVFFSLIVFAINLVRAHVNESLDAAVVSRCFKKHMGAKDWMERVPDGRRGRRREEGGGGEKRGY